jgi:AAA+ superfamily predicted ATPase
VLISQDKTKYYSLSCRPGCTGGQIKAKLSKLERVDAAALVIEEIGDDDIVEQLLDWASEESPCFVFWAHKDS